MLAKSIIAGFLCASFSHLLYADYEADDLQKLFTDKHQRAQIDAVRSGNHSVTDSPQTNQVKVSGYLTRSDGKSVVWLNNKNTLDSSQMGDVRVHQSSVGRNKKVTVSVDGAAVRLKPGETWTEETGVSDTTN